MIAMVLANIWSREPDDPAFRIDQFTPILAGLPETPPWEEVNADAAAEPAR